VLANVCRSCGSILVERARANLTTVRCVDCGAEHDPTQSDLQHAHTGRWGPLRLASLRPGHTLAELLGPMPAALADRPLDAAVRSETCSRDFLVPAPWRAYVEDAAAIATEVPTHRWAFGLAWPHRWLLAPGTIVDVHDWGLSVRAVQPLSVYATRVVLETWLWSDDAGPGAAELSDQHYAIERRVVRRARGRSSRAHAGRDWSPPAAVEALRAILASVTAA